MKYHENNYEDELDRMRARRERKKKAAPRTSRPLQDNDFEYIDNIEDADDIQASGSFQTPKRRLVQEHPRVPSHPRRKRKRKNIGIRLILVLAIILAGIFFYHRLTAQKGWWTIAVFGVDSRDGNLGRGALSDVEMLCSINRQTGEIRLASVFRDTYLRIDDDGSYDKINEAYFLGGHKQAISALEANLGLKVDDYATFNWAAVINAINALGGVDLEITDKEFAYINSFITETVESTGIGSYQLEHSGMNHLDGVQAVAYARLRLMDTDFNRTERQRKVLGLAMEKAKQADAKTLKTLAGAIVPQISTSIGPDDILSMAKNAKKYYIGQTSGFPFSHTEMKIGKKSCVIPTTLESNVIQLHQFLYDDAQYIPSETVHSISNKIAEKSGLSEPGKDTESGKNIGAQGNTGGGQGSQQAAPQPTATDPSPKTGSETGQTDEPTSMESTETEPISSETEESGATEEGGKESEAEPETVPEPEDIITPSTDFSTETPTESSHSNGVTEPHRQPTTPDQQPGGSPTTGPGSSTQKPGTSNSSGTSLEAPGQNNESTTNQAGPGM